MDDAIDRRMSEIANRVLPFLGRTQQFSRIGDELPGDGIAGVVTVDQCSHFWRDGDSVARRHIAKAINRLARHQPGGQQIFRGVQRAARAHADVSGTGAHITWSMRGAPVASITSRSKPSAMPLASGMIARAARNSSSSG